MPPPPPPPSLLLPLLLLLLLLLQLLCRYSLLRAFQKTQNEKQSFVTGCAPRCIAGREAAAAQQQQHSSSRSNSSSGGGGGGGAVAAAASSPSEPRAGCCVSVAERVCALSVCASWPSIVPWLRGFGLGIKLGACRPIVWTAGARINLERSSVQIVSISYQTAL